MTSSLSITSICRTLPTPEDASAGVFVLRRIAAFAARARVEIVQPLPYFPGLRPLPVWAAKDSHDAAGATIRHAPMFYLPGALKQLDGHWLYRAIRERLQALRHERRLDLIDAHFAYPDGAGCARAARDLDVPYTVTMRGVEEDYMQSPRLRREIVNTLRGADACICVSHSLTQVAVDAGVARERIHVIHNAVNRDVFAPGETAGARCLLGVRPDEVLIVSVGNLLAVKRHDVLIRAFAKIPHHRARLVVIGGAMHEPAHPAELRALCAELGVADRVDFAGRLEEAAVATWLRAADLFALASRREGCCNAVLEALASGVPVVATSVGDNPHFVTDGENGRLVGVDDVDALAEAMSDELRREKRDPRRIAQSLDVGDWPTVAARTIGLFEECVRRRTAAH